jgi:hypothetical protein
MDEKLYRKRMTPGGKVVYDEVFQHWQGDPKPGIWYVAQEKHGSSYRWLAERLEDLPKARKLAELEPYRDKLCEILADSSTPRSINDTVTQIFEALGGNDVSEVS